MHDNHYHNASKIRKIPHSQAFPPPPQPTSHNTSSHNLDFRPPGTDYTNLIAAATNVASLNLSTPSFKPSSASLKLFHSCVNVVRRYPHLSGFYLPLSLKPSSLALSFWKWILGTFPLKLLLYALVSTSICFSKISSTSFSKAINTGALCLSSLLPPLPYSIYVGLKSTSFCASYPFLLILICSSDCFAAFFLVILFSEIVGLLLPPSCLCC